MLSRFWFNFIHKNFLIYNICWEDSDIDRELLQINAESQILMITSAGCNALNYLLDDPHSIECVDINPKQNALLELKLALVRHTDKQTLFQFFGEGRHPLYQQIYQKIRNELSYETRTYWDNKITCFDPMGRGFFYHGGAGLFARFLTTFFRSARRRDLLLKLLQEPFRERREELYQKLEQQLFSGLRSRLWKSQAILALAGIPDQQRAAIGDMDQFMKKNLRNLFVEQRPGDNFFWKTYLNGRMSSGCSPAYLKAQNFDHLQERADRIQLFSRSLVEHLQQSDSSYSHVILLDHMDWLAKYDPQALEMTWKHLIRRTRSHSLILFRTAFSDISFLPDFIHDKIELRQVDPGYIADHDKVGTYTGTWLAEAR